MHAIVELQQSTHNGQHLYSTHLSIYFQDLVWVCRVVHKHQTSFDYRTRLTQSLSVIYVHCLIARFQEIILLIVQSNI